MAPRIHTLSVLVFIHFTLTGFAQETLVFDDGWGDGIEVVSQTAEELELLYSVPQITFQKIDGMTKVLLPGAYLGNNAGAPDLPGISRFIAFPRGASVEMEIVDSRVRVFEEMEIAPAPPIPLDTDDSDPVYEKDPYIYSMNAFYPSQPVVLSAPYRLRGVDAVLMGITPFSYNPVTKELVVHTDLRIKVSFKGGRGTIGEDRLRSRWFEPLMKQHFLNYASLKPVSFNVAGSSSRAPDECEYMIFVPDDADFLAWADVIKAFRVKQGITTNVFNIADLGGTANGIENKINDAYNNWANPPVAVLMLGDLPYMPVKTWDGYCLSDNIYADVNNDDLPDVNIARMTARDNAQLDLLISKFIDYETAPPTAADFYDEPVVAGGWQTERWFILCTEVVYGFLANEEGKHPLREYAIYSGTPGTKWSTATNTSTVVNYFGPSGLGYIPSNPSHLTDWGGNAMRINNDLNAGAFYMLHRDHGYELGWGEPDYDLYDLAGLNNDDLPFVMSINCCTGNFGYSPQCFTEAFHRMQHGALGLIAASHISYSFVNDTFVWGMHDALWPHFDPGYGGSTGDNVLMPGFAHASGKWYLEASSWPYNSSSKEVTHHLFHMHGDAFTQLYSEVPQPLTVSHDANIDSAATTFDVTADAGSLIGLSFGGNVLGTATGTGGAVSVNIVPPGAAGTMHVTVTLANHFRYEAQVTVIEGGPPVVEDVNPGDGGISGGTACTVTGHNFTTTADTSVTFGSASAGNVHVVDAVTLTCDAPAHAAGTVGVTVTNSNGSDTLAGAFTYHDPPQITSLSPDSGPMTGGTLVTLTGTDFTEIGPTSVTFGGASATGVSVVDSTTITSTVPSHAPGDVDVTVINDFGSDTLTGGYTYNDPPAISGVSPQHGTTAGGTSITVTGSHFSGTMSVTFGGVAAANVVVVSSGTLTCTAPAHSSGLVDVAVTNADGSDTLPGAFTYHAPPQISSIDPNNGPMTGATFVTLTGSDFTEIGVTAVTFDGLAASSVAVVDATTLTCLTPAHNPGIVDVQMTNDFGVDTLNKGYVYNSQPNISSVTPSHGTVSGGTAVTVSGSNLTGTTTVTFGGSTASNIVFVNSSTLTCDSPAHGSGLVDVTVSNINGSDTLPGAFTYHDAPQIISLDPINGPVAGGTSVTVTGNDFTEVGSTSVTFGSEFASDVVVVDATTLTCTTPAHAPGPVDVTVINDFGSDTFTNGYAYNFPPEIVSIDPTHGPVAGGTAVTVTGNHFTFTADTEVTFGGKPANNIEVVDATTLTCTSPPHMMGAVYVDVTNSNGSDLLPTAFIYHDPPSLASVSPDHGTVAGGSSVTLSGDAFTAGDTEVYFDGALATDIIVVNATTLTCTTPAVAHADFIDVEVSNPYGSDTLANAYFYLPASGSDPLNLTDVDTLNLNSGDVVTHAVTGPPGALYMLFLSFGGGPVNSPWGTAGLDVPIYYIFAGNVGVEGYSTLKLKMPATGLGFMNFYTQALVDNVPPMWAQGGNNPNGTGSVLWGLN